MSAYLCLVLALFTCVTVISSRSPLKQAYIEVLSSSRSVIDRVHERSSVNASTRHTCWDSGDPKGPLRYYGGGGLISAVRRYCNEVKPRLDSGNGHGIFALAQFPNCKAYAWRIRREMHWARTVLATCEAVVQPDQKRRDPLNHQPVTLDEFIQAHIDEDHPESPPIFSKADVLTEMWSFAKVLVEERIDPKYRPGAVPLKAYAEMLESEALPEDEVNRRWNSEFPEVPSKISYAEFLKAHAEDGMPEDQLKSVWDTLEAGDYRELEGAHPLCEVLDEDASAVCGWF